MSYVKQTWATGDIITAEKLNHMESGIEAVAGLVPTPTFAERGAYLKVGVDLEHMTKHVMIPDQSVNFVSSDNPITFTPEWVIEPDEKVGPTTELPYAEFTIDGTRYEPTIDSKKYTVTTPLLTFKFTFDYVTRVLSLVVQNDRGVDAPGTYEIEMFVDIPAVKLIYDN